ncbi:MAG: biopolymer transporter ExbD [Candidatus Eisenbacteria bacterium]|nr:biopolymer transporter ExbD [Candidatus Eisenbacteria bacterium]
MELRRKAGTGAKIPTASMADIAFLLIIFFMVTTIFKLEQGLAITLPRSTAGEKIPREKVAHIWIDRTGVISIDDLVVGIPDIEPLILAKIRENMGLIISFNTDERAPYRIVNDAMERLKLANALRVSFTTVPQEQ